MQTGLLISLLLILLVISTVLFFKWEVKRKSVQRNLLESVFGKFGLTAVARANYLPPALGGVYRRRQVSICSGVGSASFTEDVQLFRQLSGGWGPQLLQGQEGEFSYIRVSCDNAFDFAFYLMFDLSGAKGATEFERKFRVQFRKGGEKFGEGGEKFGQSLLTEELQRELLSTVNRKWLHGFENLTLLGKSLLYIERGRIKNPEQAERFARMLDALCDVADRVEAPARSFGLIL